MFVLVWRYRVPRETEAAFLESYAADGAWARLFRRADGYLGTELLRGDAEPDGTSVDFVTLDRWESRQRHADFLARFGAAYRRLDEACEGLTEAESDPTEALPPARLFVAAPARIGYQWRVRSPQRTPR